MKLRKFVSSIPWFLKRPKLIPHAFYLITLKVKSNFDKDSDKAKQWCKSQEIEYDDVIIKITGRKPERAKVTEMFPDEFLYAYSSARKCPVTMGGGGHVELIYSCAEHTRAKRVLETGVAYGWSSLVLLLSMKSRKNALLISTDIPYVAKDNEDFVGCVVPDELKQNWKIFRKQDSKAIPEALKLLGTIDLCHYDSDKSYDGRMRSYPILWNALRDGGIFISDDISDNTAFMHFHKMIGYNPIITRTSGKHVGIIVKSSQWKIT